MGQAVQWLASRGKDVGNISPAVSQACRNLCGCAPSYDNHVRFCRNLANMPIIFRTYGIVNDREGADVFGPIRKYVTNNRPSNAERGADALYHQDRLVIHLFGGSRGVDHNEGCRGASPYKAFKTVAICPTTRVNRRARVFCYPRTFRQLNTSFVDYSNSA